MKPKLSRRKFVALSCLGTAGGFWISKSNSFPARFIRERVAEVSREIIPAKNKPQVATWNSNAVTASWLGHSTVLINFYGLTILTDPVLGSRVGADLGIGTLGPKRLIAPALTVRELPPIDLVLLSHAHLDHLDLPTLKQLSPGTQVVTARNTSDVLTGTKMKVAGELGWGEKTVAQTANGDAEIKALEVKHWGGRWSRKEQRGWNGYIVSRNGRKILFGGDTANCDHFRSARPDGPFDLAIMPIGAYNPWIMAHCTPEEAVAMANSAGAKYIMPVHHKAFALGREPMNEPIERFEAALQNESDRICLRDVGETFTIS